MEWNEVVLNIFIYFILNTLVLFYDSIQYKNRLILIKVII